MKEIKIHKKPSLKNPVLLAAWPGMGNVAFYAIDYIRKNLKAELFAEIDMKNSTAPDAIIVQGGIAHLPVIPKSLFYYTKQPDLMIFESEAQVSGKDIKHFAEKILDLAKVFKVQRIFTGASFPIAVSHKEPSHVYAVANKPTLKNSLKDYGIKIMRGGHISGLNGLMLGFAKERKMDAACLLATIPLYAIEFPNPKASKAIVEVLEMILGIKVNMIKIDKAVQTADERMSTIERKIKDIFPLAEEKEQVSESENIPGYIMEKIERLFREVQKDKTKATLLKQELDQWNLYELYEDKFLDLFKKEH